MMKKYTQLLKEINMPNLKFVAKGMQCLVFEHSVDRVIKIYGKDVGKENLQRLMKFYNSLDTSKVDFSTPKILNIEEINDRIVVTEKKLHRKCLTVSALKRMRKSELEKFYQSYIDTLFKIQDISTKLLDNYEPLDLTGKFFKPKKYSSWNDLINYNIERKYNEQKYIFNEKISDAEKLVESIKQCINDTETSEPKLIHGDYFPGNLMIDSDFKVQAVLDFGILTTVGDPLFDIALGWTFSDMYDEVKHFPIKNYTKELIRGKIDKKSFDRMKLYILVYSFISANMYENCDPNEGHFRWAIKNLNDESLREVLLQERT